MIRDFPDFGVKYTRGRFLTVELTPRSPIEGQRNYKFLIYNNRSRTKRPVATLTTKVGTILLKGKLYPSFTGTLKIRPDIPFSQEELRDLPADVATLMHRVLDGNPAMEKFIVKITCPILDDNENENDKMISETLIEDMTNLKNHYTIFTGRSVCLKVGSDS